MNLINVKSGKVNARDSLSECFVFYTPRNEVDPEGFVETFVGKAAREMRYRGDQSYTIPLREHGSPIVVPSLANMPQERGGSLATAHYEIADGVILKVCSKRRLGWNSTLRSSVVFLRMRETAAYQSVKFHPARSNALAMDTLGVQGRFDIITLEEAEAFGARVNPATRILASLDPDSDLTTVEVIEVATSEAVQLKTLEGTERLMPIVPRRRKIDEA